MEIVDVQPRIEQASRARRMAWHGALDDSRELRVLAFVDHVRRPFGGGFDDYFRYERAQEIREAMAGAALLFMNDRAYAISKCNEAIDKYNAIVTRSGEATEVMTALPSLEAPNPNRPVTTSVPEAANNSSDNPSTVEEAISSPAKMPEASAPSEPPIETSSDPETESPDVGDNEVESDGQRTEAADGGKGNRVPSQIQLKFNAFNRKIESQRNQINRLEERLRQYEKD